VLLVCCLALLVGSLVAYLYCWLVAFSGCLSVMLRWCLFDAYYFTCLVCRYVIWCLVVWWIVFVFVVFDGALIIVL